MKHYNTYEVRQSFLGTGWVYRGAECPEWAKIKQMNSPIHHLVHFDQIVSKAFEIYTSSIWGFCSVLSGDCMCLVTSPMLIFYLGKSRAWKVNVFGKVVRFVVVNE